MNKRIKELRKTLGLTLEKFGEKLGVKRNTVSQWESGTNSVTDQMFKAICNTNWNGKYVNEDWLRSGTGGNSNMFRHPPDTKLKEMLNEYGLTHKDYIFIEKLLKNRESLSALENFCLEYANSLYNRNTLQQLEQNHVSEKPSIDEQVEDYRRQLEAEEKATEKSSVLPKNA